MEGRRSQPASTGPFCGGTFSTTEYPLIAAGLFPTPVPSFFPSFPVASTVHSVPSTGANDSSSEEGTPGGSFRHRRVSSRACDSRRKTLRQLSWARVSYLARKGSYVSQEVRSRDLDRVLLPLDRGKPTFPQNSSSLPSRASVFPFLGQRYWCVPGERSSSQDSEKCRLGWGYRGGVRYF